LNSCSRPAIPNWSDFKGEAAKKRALVKMKMKGLSEDLQQKEFLIKKTGSTLITVGIVIRPKIGLIWSF